MPIILPSAEISAYAPHSQAQTHPLVSSTPTPKNSARDIFVGVPPQYGQTSPFSASSSDGVREFRTDSTNTAYPSASSGSSPTEADNCSNTLLNSVAASDFVKAFLIPASAQNSSVDNAALKASYAAEITDAP